MSQPEIAAESPEPAPPTRSVRHEYSLNWVPLVKHLNASLLVTTYQAGKLVVVSNGSSGLDLRYHNFDRAMGLAIRPDRLAIGARSQVWFLRNAPEIARQLDPPGSHDACFLTRGTHYTGEIQGHEMAWSGDELWIVNTGFSCLCTLDDRHSFVPRWKPPFVSELAAEDRCHLNGLAMDGGRPAYVTAMAESNTAGGWRPTKATSGCVIEVASGTTVLRGLAMPHSPRLYEGRLWLLDSGQGRLVVADLERGSVQEVAVLPGYTRGLALFGGFAFVGLSKIRETATFGGVPVAERREELKCGVAAVELASGRTAALLEFHTGVEEIFDVQVVPGLVSPVISGPYPDLDDTPPIWMVPLPKWGTV
jgi:uncharacterized protein (TIGR03032 family)